MNFIDYRFVINAIDYEKAIDIVIGFIRDSVLGASAKGVVIGVSGGLDSTVTSMLAVKALGRENVLGIIMPSRYTPREDIDDALYIANSLGIRYLYIDIDPILDSYIKNLPGFDHSNRLATGNLMPRIRMAILYYYANLYNYLVLGTGDKSEILLGYFTKYGDGGVDLLPIGDLYKVQVRRLAEIMGFEKIAKKPSSPRLWPGHRAEEELGATYEEIDPILYALFDLRIPIERAYQIFRKDLVDMVIKRYRQSEHKRRTPPIADLSSARKMVREAL